MYKLVTTIILAVVFIVALVLAQGVNDDANAKVCSSEVGLFSQLLINQAPCTAEQQGQCVSRCNAKFPQGGTALQQCKQKCQERC